MQLIVALAAVIDAGQGYGYGGYGFRRYRYGKRETVTKASRISEAFGEPEEKRRKVRFHFQAYP